MSTENERLLAHFGPDIPSRIALFTGIPGSAFILISVAIIHPAIAGPAILVLTACTWYLWRNGLKVSINIYDTGLCIETAARRFEAPWSQISDIRFRVRGHRVIYLANGSHFRLPMYSKGVQTELIIQHTSLLDVHRQLEESLTNAWKRSKNAASLAPAKKCVNWVRPPISLVLAGVGMSIAAEIGLLLAK